MLTRINTERESATDFTDCTDSKKEIQKGYWTLIPQIAQIMEKDESWCPYLAKHLSEMRGRNSANSGLGDFCVLGSAKGTQDRTGNY